MSGKTAACLFAVPSGVLISVLSRPIAGAEVRGEGEEIGSAGEAEKGVTFNTVADMTDGEVVTVAAVVDHDKSGAGGCSICGFMVSLLVLIAGVAVTNLSPLSVGGAGSDGDEECTCDDVEGGCVMLAIE